MLPPRLLLLVLLGACATGPQVLRSTQRQVFDESPPQLRVEADGTVRIQLPVCFTVKNVVYSDSPGLRPKVFKEPCTAALAPMSITRPWRPPVSFPVESSDPTVPPVVRVPPDRGDTPIDPLDPRTWPKGQPWTFTHPLLPEPVTWVPSDDDLALVARAMSGRDRIDASHEVTSRPPQLVVESLAASNDELVAGGANEMELVVVNRGEGPAYRVTATIRSSLRPLHGRQFSLGRLMPGQRLSRTLRVELPASIEDRSAMVVLLFDEANGYPPPDFSRRIPVRVVANAPHLVLTCASEAGGNEVDAGEVVRLRCDLRNEGAVVARGVVTTAAIGDATASAPPVDVAARSSVVVQLPVRISSTARIDQQIAIDLVAAATNGGRPGRNQMLVTVRRPRVCPGGRMTREAYQLRRDELARARDAGDLTDAEFDRYDAELVSCIDE